MLIPSLPEDPKWRRGVDELFRYYRGGPIVDCGCGRRLSHPDAVGIDEYAGPDRMYPREMVRPHFQRSFEDLPFKDETVTFVTSIDSIEHAKDPFFAIQEWLRVLVPGGRIAMLVPDKRYVPSDGPLAHGHNQMWTPAEFDLMLRSLAGFDVVRCEDFNEWWFIVILEKKGDE